MPIYEFSCKSCNTIFSFFSKTVNTKKEPSCPRCKGSLNRQVSMFACPDNSKEEHSMDNFPVDERKLEQAINKLASEANSMDGENTAQAADLMKKFSNMTGIKLGDGMQEALNRMESGEDPDKIEAEMGNVLENEDPFLLPGTIKSKTEVRKKALKRDETLYDL
jgi:putative FmdB family regulatory protein